ncbi:MAG: TerC family protein [Proteobacteria bacterium]|nr:MAG: TerC family protein [Pseudomonadota bacterium]
MDLALLSSPETYLSLLTLSAMEIVLGIDNIIFISILCARLPEEHREKARKIGLFGAFGTRLVLLASISWMVGLVNPIFNVGSFPVTGKAIILFIGGLFLMYKATKEIHEKVEGDGHDSHGEMLNKPAVSFKSVIIQIMLLDIVFSLDSVITAVGMSQHISIMVAANVIALIVMVFTAKSVGDFVQRHPTVKMLALSFLLLIGTVLVADAAGFHVPKGYIYFAMGFSVAVEMLNLWTKKKTVGAGK